MVKILAFSGSTRRGSLNQRLVENVAKVAEDSGAHVTLVSLSDYAMPLYNQDEEEEFGIPARAQAFKELLIAHDAFIIACPEYNSSYPAVLKNAIDWASRKSGEEPRLAAFKGKVVGLLAASPGGMGGMRVLVVLRMLMQNLHCIVAPTQVSVGNIGKKLSADGLINDETTLKQLQTFTDEVVNLAVKLNR